MVNNHKMACYVGTSRRIPFFIIILIFASQTSAQSIIATLMEPSTSTSSGTAPTTTSLSSEVQYDTDAIFQAEILAAHNFFRMEHNASILVWNDTSAQYASQWASKCGFSHSGGPTGENLAAGYPSPLTSTFAWGDERSAYDFSNPGFSEQTGHFTQVVWSSTTNVGCGVMACDGLDSTPGFYLVCEYWPPGNVIGAFPQNVQSQVTTLASPSLAAGPSSTSVVGGGVSMLPSTTASTSTSSASQGVGNGAGSVTSFVVGLRLLAVVLVGGGIGAALL